MTRPILLACTAMVATCVCLGVAAQEDDGVVGPLLEQCKADAAKRADVALDDVMTLSLDGVIWRSGALGCPRPGMDYMQMLVPGYKIVIRAGDRKYEYHTDKGKRFVYCEDGGEEPAEFRGISYRLPEEPEVAPPPRPVSGAMVLYLDPMPDDPNGNSLLKARGAIDDGRLWLIHGCTDFAVSDEGWVIAKRRTSRSTHDLLFARLGLEPRAIMTAFDFEALAFSESDSTYAFLAQVGAGEPFKVYVGALDQEPRPLDWAPTANVGEGAAISLTGSALVLIVPDPEEELPWMRVLDLDKQREVAAIHVPKAQAVYVQEAD